MRLAGYIALLVAVYDGFTTFFGFYGFLASTTSDVNVVALTASAVFSLSVFAILSTYFPRVQAKVGNNNTAKLVFVSLFFVAIVVDLWTAYSGTSNLFSQNGLRVDAFWVFVLSLLTVGCTLVYVWLLEGGRSEY